MAVRLYCKRVKTAPNNYFNTIIINALMTMIVLKFNSFTAFHENNELKNMKILSILFF